MKKKHFRGTNIGCFISLFWLLITVIGLIGEIKCIYKAIDSDWNPIGKREFVYSLGAVTGTGAVIGWLNIPDEPYEKKK